MLDVILTQNNTPVFKYIVWFLGKIMEGIYNILDLIHLPNIGVVIILFTIVMYTLMLPLTIKQQKFSKLSARMNPEIQAIRDKYKNKKDNASMMAMNQETQAVYAKYGVNPAGSCLQLLIQMPVLFALYRVIYSIPAYVGKIKNIFVILIASVGLVGTPADVYENVDQVYGNAEVYELKEDAAIPVIKDGKSVANTETRMNEFKELFQDNSSLKQYLNNIDSDDRLPAIQNEYIDTINHFNAKDWQDWIDYYQAKVDDEKTNEVDRARAENSIAAIKRARSEVNERNMFLGLNVGYSPKDIISGAWGSNWLLVIGAVLIPLLAGLTQYVNVKLAPASNSNTNDQNNTMNSSMKVMNMIMPIISVIFCYSLQVGVGIYWIASAVVRTVQQIVINKRIDKMDLDEVMKRNIEKNNQKRARMGLPPQQLSSNANLNTKKINTAPAKPSKSAEERADQVQKSTEYYNKNAKPGSLASKVNMVKQYNEKNNK